VPAFFCAVVISHSVKSKSLTDIINKHKTNQKMKSKLLNAALIAGFSVSMYAQTVPTPDHVVILMLENFGYNNIIGNSNAPHINALTSDPNAAVFTQSFGLTHPSQPNYVMLYSGSNQGITNDVIATNVPFSTCNLGASLISKGHTFKGYSEGLPAVGSLTTASGNYARKHAPWTNWQGTGTNQVPSSVNQPYTSFPSSANYSSLPTVSFVIPNLADDMHNPTTNTVTAISNGDTWVYNNITAYIQWAKANNSLLILTFDEDDGTIGVGTNQITTIFIGQMVQGGSYSENINHYRLLRTIEDMYGITTYCGASSTSAPITNCWKATNTTGITQNEVSNNNVNIWPVPAKQNFNIGITSSISDIAVVSIYDLTGRVVKQEEITIKTGDNTFSIDAQNITSGVYVVKVSGKGINICKKIVFE